MPIRRSARVKAKQLNVTQPVLTGSRSAPKQAKRRGGTKQKENVNCRPNQSENTLLTSSTVSSSYSNEQFNVTQHAHPPSRATPKRGRKRKSTTTSRTKQVPVQNSTVRASTNLQPPRPQPRPRPTVISLDVTYSEPSDLSDDSDIEEISTPSPAKAPKLTVPKETPTKLDEKNTKKNSQSKPLSASPWPLARTRDGRCTISDSDESDTDVFVVSAPRRQTASSVTANGGSCYESDLEDDLYGVHFEEERLKAINNMVKVLNEKKDKSSLSGRESPVVERRQLTRTRLKESPDKKSIKEDIQELTNEPRVSPCKADTSLDIGLDLNNIDVSSIQLRGSAGKVRRTREAKKAIQSLQAFSKRTIQNTNEPWDKSSNDLSLDDDVIVADTSSDFPIRLRWGASYVRQVINKSIKFVNLYQEIAEKHGVSVSQVVLSFQDNVIAPQSTPLDIGLSIGDVIECGIISQSEIKSSEKTNNTQQLDAADGDWIPLKVQTANRKTFHTLQINQYDKLSVLMQQYSKLRNIPLSKLKFKFDGETLEDSDTPFSLDLEGGECIDVFEL